MSKPHTLIFGRSGAIPNNPALPALIYEDVLTEGDLAAGLERMFAAHGWPPQWRDGIHDFHHYHSTAHEVLGIARGEARVVLGGPGGEELPLFAGDVVVLPAGTGHRRIAASQDFLVVGGYPQGQDWDLIRADEPEKLAAAVQRIARVPLPRTDPVAGANGPLVHLWGAARGAA